MIASALSKHHPGLHTKSEPKKLIEARNRIARSCEDVPAAIDARGIDHQRIVRESANTTRESVISASQANRSMADTVNVHQWTNGLFEISESLQRSELLPEIAASSNRAQSVINPAERTIIAQRIVRQSAQHFRDMAESDLRQLRAFPWQQVGIIPIKEIRSQHAAAARTAATEFAPHSVDPFRPNQWQVVSAIVKWLIGKREW